MQTSRNRSRLMSRNQRVSVDALKVCMPALPLRIRGLVSHPLPADLLQEASWEDFMFLSDFCPSSLSPDA